MIAQGLFIVVILLFVALLCIPPEPEYNWINDEPWLDNGDEEP